MLKPRAAMQNEIMLSGINYLSTEPKTKSAVPKIVIRSANEWLFEIRFNACKLY